MALLQFDVRNGIAWVTFDSGGMNTLSQAAVNDLKTVTAAIAKAHATTPLVGVILKGNKFGLGAGANIAELMNADAAELGRFIDVGHEALYAIEEGPLPWLTVVDGFALGGIYRSRSRAGRSSRPRSRRWASRRSA
jgi:enoyl-CoA hydratase/carnithine racemase